MMPPTYPGTDHCSMCNAYWPLEGQDVGYCLRYPPQVRFGSHVKQPGDDVPRAESFYPVVEAGWWCREFKKQV